MSYHVSVLSHTFYKGNHTCFSKADCTTKSWLNGGLRSHLHPEQVNRLAGVQPANMRPVEFQYLGFLIDPNKEPWPEHDSADDNEPLPEHDSADDSERDADALARIAERDARSDSSGADVGSRVPSSIGISSAGPSASMLWLGHGHP